MNDYRRDIIFLLKEDGFTQEHFDLEVQFLHKTIAIIDNDRAFCDAHELVVRNRISQKKSSIIKAIRRTQLKPFRFLINKN